MRSCHRWLLRLGILGVVCLSQATASVPAPLTAASALNHAFQAGSRLTAVALSPDGKTLATTGNDNRVLLWDVTSRQERAALVGNASPITGIAFDPSGKNLAAVGEDHRIVLWNLATGTKTMTLLADRLRTNVTEVAFSPDGATLASIGDDPRVVLWDLATGATEQVLSGHSDVVNGIAFSPDGKLLASGSRDSTAILWDPTSGAERAVLRSPDGASVTQVAFSSDGKSLLSVRSDGGVLIWDIATRGLQQTLSSSADHFTRAAFSPDGRLLASVDEANRVNLWEVATGRLLLVLADPPGIPVSELAFSGDGSVLASARGDTVGLWSTGSGGPISTCFGDHAITVTSAVFSPDGATLAGVSGGDRILLWDAQTGITKRVLIGHQVAINRLVFSPDGRSLASGSTDGTIGTWDVATGLERSTLSGGTGLAVSHLAYSADGMTLASSQGSRITLWSSDSPPMARVLAGQSVISSMALSPDGKFIASGGSDAQIKLWAVAGGQLQATLPGQVGGAVVGLLFSPDTATLASLSSNNQIQLWSVPSLNLRRAFNVPGDVLALAAFGLNGQTIAGLSDDGHLTVWDVAVGMQQLAVQVPAFGTTGQPAVGSASNVGLVIPTPSGATPSAQANPSLVFGASPSTNPVSPNTPPAPVQDGRKGPRAWAGVTAMAVSPNGTLLGTGGKDGTVRLWNVAGGTAAGPRATFVGHQGTVVTGLAFSTDGKRLVTGGRDSEVRVWDTTTAKPQLTLRGHEQPIRTIAASPDGHLLASAGEETRIMLWNAATGQLEKILNAHKDFVNSLAFSADGTRLASGGADKHVIVWDVASGKPLQTLLAHTGEISAVAFSPDGKWLASAGKDTRVILWNAATGQEIKSLAGHQGPVRSVAFSPDGKTLVSAGEDAKILVWEPATGKLVTSLSGASHSINALAFHPTGDLFSAGEDNQLTQWDHRKGTRVQTLLIPVGPVGPHASTPRSFGSASVVASTRPSLTVQTTEPQTAWSVTESLSNLIARALDWLVPSASAATLPGAGHPILLVTAAPATFSTFYTEILHTEGLNLFDVADISTVTATTLSAYQVVILGSTPLTAAQVTIFTNWVNGGGNLIAMRPDPQLANLLGLTPLGTTLSNAYLLVDTSRTPGNGIVGQTMQFHGTADLYALNGASSLVTFYSNATTPTLNPAVTLNNVGLAGGHAAAFAYDLATSIVYMRQGNPAWVTQERDGLAPIRSDDKFYGHAVDATQPDGSILNDPEPDWVDLNNDVAIPQADEQQRLLANLILDMNIAQMPIPRFWYFPNGKKAVVVMTGDDHANGGTGGRFDKYIADSPVGCNVANWECVRSTSNIYPETTKLTPAQAANYVAQGFEVSMHLNTGCVDYTQASLDALYTQQMADFATAYPNLPAPKTQRQHCVVWSDWISGAKEQLKFGMRLDTSYYFWPPTWLQDRPGHFTGSAMPMRFADLDGTIIDVYNTVTQLTDESGQSYPLTSETLLGAAVGPQGFYGVYSMNAHTDAVFSSASDALVASAQSRGIPVVSQVQLLNWLDARNSSSLGTLGWDGSNLSFVVTPGTGANGLQAMVPLHVPALVLSTVTGPSGPVPYTTSNIKGVDYGSFPAAAGNYTAAYIADTTHPTVTSTSPANGATGLGTIPTIGATFSKSMDPTTINTNVFTLNGPATQAQPNGTPVSAKVTYVPATQTATLVPTGSLAPATTYSASVTGGKDLAGNALAAGATWSFTTFNPASCPCDGFSSSATPVTPDANDPSAVEVGVKFQVDVAGVVSGVRFYKAANNTGTHIGNLWTRDGQLLATATFTNETATGWQQVSFSNPVSVATNTVYVASYFAPNGHYAADSGYFATSGVDNPPVHLLKDGVSGGDGVYAYGASSTFPSSSFQSNNYWVDLAFIPNTGPPTLAVATTTPPIGGTGVGSLTTVSATFNNALNPTTVNTSTFTLTGPGNVLVPASVSASGSTATLTPTSPLVGSSTYTASFTTAVTDVSGNALPATYSWLFTTATVSAECTSPPNAIVAENCQPGTLQSAWDVNGAGDATIQGFATDISVNQGDTIKFKINTDATAYQLDIYRMGYYAGNGARKVATVLPAATLPQTQPACLTDPTTQLIDCGNWAVSASWTVPANATSGIYFARLVRLDTLGASHIVFIVRNDASHSNLLFQTSDTSWQAYNDYLGIDLYGCNGTFNVNCRAFKVSYNRPFHTRSFERMTWLFNAEYPMVRWLEANGYDVSYFSEIDTERNAALIMHHKVWMSNGHDEYWSGGLRASVTAARDAGVHLAFFSGNTMFWKTRWENSIDGSGTPYRTLVCYKETHANAVIDPLDSTPTWTWTGTWRDPRFSPPGDGGKPENALVGTIFRMNGGQNGTITVPQADGQMRFWRNTPAASLGTGQVATLAPGTIGGEFDDDEDNGFRPPGLIELSSTSITDPVNYLLDFGSTYGAGTAIHKVTLYKAPSGALVFAAGTYQWSWGLDANHDQANLGSTTNLGMQQATVNLFADMGVQPATLQAGLTPATASTDTSPPSSMIVAPVNTSSVSVSKPVVISGTATDVGGGVVAGVEVSVDGGATWHPAIGLASWSYTWTPAAAGTFTIKSRAVDDSGNLETPNAGVTVSVVNGCGLGGFELTPILPLLLWLRGRRGRKSAVV